MQDSPLLTPTLALVLPLPTPPLPPRPTDTEMSEVSTLTQLFPRPVFAQVTPSGSSLSPPDRHMSQSLPSSKVTPLLATHSEGTPLSSGLTVSFMWKFAFETFHSHCRF